MHRTPHLDTLSVRERAVPWKTSSVMLSSPRAPSFKRLFLLTATGVPLGSGWPSSSNCNRGRRGATARYARSRRHVP